MKFIDIELYIVKLLQYNICVYYINRHGSNIKYQLCILLRDEPNNENVIYIWM